MRIAHVVKLNHEELPVVTKLADSKARRKVSGEWLQENLASARVRDRAPAAA